MKYVRIYTDAAGETHFEDVEVTATTQGSTVSTSISNVSALIPVEGLIFREVVREAQSDTPHVAPRRQFVIHLTGQSEVEVSDGEKRRFGPGVVTLAEDTTGKGHITRGVGSGERTTLFVPLPNAPRAD